MNSGAPQAACRAVRARQIPRDGFGCLQGRRFWSLRPVLPQTEPKKTEQRMDVSQLTDGRRDP